eukprot:g15133.t1
MSEDKHGRTAVYCAAHSNLKSTVFLLHDKGADITLRPAKRGGKSQTGAAKLLDDLLKKVDAAQRPEMPRATAFEAGESSSQSSVEFGARAMKNHERLVYSSQVLFWDDEERGDWGPGILRLKENGMLVFGGDAPDKGPGDIRLVKILLSLKRRYPEPWVYLGGRVLG